MINKTYNRMRLSIIDDTKYLFIKNGTGMWPTLHLWRSA